MSSSMQRLHRPWGAGLAALLALCLLLPLALGLGERERPVERGCVDLRGVDLAGGQPLELRGDWEFFDGKLIVTELSEDASPDDLVSVPAYLAGGWQVPLRWGSYRVKLLHCPPEVAVTVSLRGMPAAYRIFLNGQPVESGGLVTRTASTAAVWAGHTQEAGPPLRASTCELVIEVSGRYLPGLSTVPVLMERERYNERYQRYQAVVLLLFGMGLLMAAAYAMDVLLTPRSGYSPAMLAALCLLLLHGLSTDVLFSVLRGGHGAGYDVVQLAAYGVRLAAWAILLRLDYGRGTGVPLRSGACAVLYGLLFLCLLAPAARVGTLWWLSGDVAVGLLLIWRTLTIAQRVQAGPQALLEGGYLLLWLGCVLEDMARAGLLSRGYRLSYFMGMVLFALAVSYVDRRRMDGIQSQALRTAQMEAQLQRARTDIALHQIKPHFLHNALMSIKVLCRTRPKEAEAAVYDFAVFLRNNMNSIESPEPVPFGVELRTIQGYLHIEQIRFGARLKVAWDLGETDFSVPPLTIQPLVENAVRHGICQKPEGGTVTIASRQAGDEVVVEIRDDGVGFDVSSAEQGGGIGLRNLRLRLKERIGATLELESEPGMGTIQRVHIPVKGEGAT